MCQSCVTVVLSCGQHILNEDNTAAALFAAYESCQRVPYFDSIVRRRKKKRTHTHTHTHARTVIATAWLVMKKAREKKGTGSTYVASTDTNFPTIASNAFCRKLNLLNWDKPL